MHKIYFYKDKNGKEPLKEYFEELASKNDKDSRIKLNKIPKKKLIIALSVWAAILSGLFIYTNRKFFDVSFYGTILSVVINLILIIFVSIHHKRDLR